MQGKKLNPTHDLGELAEKDDITMAKLTEACEGDDLQGACILHGSELDLHGG